MTRKVTPFLYKLSLFDTNEKLIFDREVIKFLLEVQIFSTDINLSRNLCLANENLLFNINLVLVYLFFFKLFNSND